MCGICGIVKAGERVDSADLRIIESMKLSLSHRGPDGEGTAFGRKFAFGHQRLAIIDIEHNIQPMQSENKQFTLTYNGEIYNYLELRQELSRKGVRFRTFSDTEVLLQLLAHKGVACVSKLNGMFSFALFDENTNTFIAARDHFGIKPFYFSHLKSGDLIFASEIKALLQHPEIYTQVNQGALQEYMTFQFCLGEKTLFKGIRKLEPGHFMVWKTNDERECRIEKYWDLDYTIDVHHTEDYFADTLLMLLQDSVSMQLRSDVPVGGYLSGGLDSSTICSIAASLYGDGFKCFTGIFNQGKEYDECQYAKIVAESSSCHIETITITPGDFVENLQKLIYYMDEPAAGPGLLPQYIVSRTAARSVKVVLGGQGGDEIFSGYARYLIGYLEQTLKGAIFETQEEGKHFVTMASIIPHLPLLRQYTPLMQHFWRDGLFGEMDARYFRLIDRSPDIETLLTVDASAQFNKEAMYLSFQAIFNHPDTVSYVNKMTHFDLKTLLPALLHVEDRVSMAASLESRVPLLDARIVNLVTSMPPPMKFQGGETKHILKSAVRNIVPEAVHKRKDKMGFPVPLKEWTTTGPVRDFILDILLSRSSKERGIFNIGKLERLMATETAFGRQIWGTLCIELWYQIFIDKPEIRHGYDKRQ